MKVAARYHDQAIEFDVSDESLVGVWEGPEGLEGEPSIRLFEDALGSAIDYPALRETVVPGDRVTIALGSDVPEASRWIGTILRVLDVAGVTPDLVTVIVEPGTNATVLSDLPKAVTIRRHDPADREAMAYLANTSSERRVYLSRDLVDADFVVTVGTVGFDSHLGYRGPWSALFPGLSDEETRAAFQSRMLAESPDPDSPPPLLKESWEVSWLLGSQFQVGVLPGIRGVRSVLCGLGPSFHSRCVAENERIWGFHPDSTAELVVAGIGSAGRVAGIDDVARGLSAAAKLVNPGGKIVLLSAAEGPLGLSVRRLIEAEMSGRRSSPLKGLEAESDYATASMIAKATAWADVYMLSRFEQDDVEGLGMIPLDQPREAARLAGLSRSCMVISQAERVGVKLIEVSDETI